MIRFTVTSYKREY